MHGTDALLWLLPLLFPNNTSAMSISAFQCMMTKALAPSMCPNIARTSADQRVSDLLRHGQQSDDTSPSVVLQKSLSCCLRQL